MSLTSLVRVRAVLVEHEVDFTLEALSHACLADPREIMALVQEGVLIPAGGTPPQWRFQGSALRRARKALRLGRELQLNPAGIALVLDLLDELEPLRLRP
jgi:chaperone modulatory protein CbpM